MILSPGGVVNVVYSERSGGWEKREGERYEMLLCFSPDWMDHK
jgi:hypothetical protein